MQQCRQRRGAATRQGALALSTQAWEEQAAADHLTSWLTMMLSFPPELSRLLFQLSAFTLAACPFSALTCLLRLTSQIWTCSTHMKHSG